MDRTDNHPRLSDIAQEEILCQIYNGGLAVGSKLPSEPELARQMGISRGILREALNALQARGFITRSPRGGSHITRRDLPVLIDGMSQGLMKASISDLIDSREALETFAAQRVLRQASDEDLATLHELTLFTDDQVVSGSRAFHFRLAELSGIMVFAHFMDFYFERVVTLASSYEHKYKPKNIGRELERIVQALENRNQRQLNAALRRHFKDVRRYHGCVLSAEARDSSDASAS